VLAPVDVVRVGGLRATSVQRTAIDIARMLPPADALPLLRALQGVGLDPERARQDLASLRGYRGIRQADATLRSLELRRG
jgi:hypothetical protein